MELQQSRIPDFRPDGYLLDGMFLASEAEVTFRFGTSNRRRRRLVIRVRRWIELARKIKAPRLFIDGSFITAKPEPKDVDAVVLLPPDFEDRITANSDAAIEFEEMLLTRLPEEIFAAEDETDRLGCYAARWTKPPIEDNPSGKMEVCTSVRHTAGGSVAQRPDVDEEMDRIEAHIDAVRLALNGSEPVGRRLDFLTQELNRRPIPCLRNPPITGARFRISSEVTPGFAACLFSPYAPFYLLRVVCQRSTRRNH